MDPAGLHDAVTGRMRKSSNTVVTGTYYNPSKDAENTAQTVGTEADANDVLDAMEQGTEQEGTSIGADLF